MLLFFLEFLAVEILVVGGFVLTLDSNYDEKDSSVVSTFLSVLAAYFWPLWWAAKAIPMPAQLFLAEAR